jgi:hypothetical protein
METIEKTQLRELIFQFGLKVNKDGFPQGYGPFSVGN